MKNFLWSILGLVKSKEESSEIRVVEDFDKAVKNSLKAVEELQESVKKEKKLLIVAIEGGTNNNEIAENTYKNLKERIGGLKKDLEVLSRILEMKKPIGKYLLEPIRKSLRVAFWVTVGISFIGLLLAGPDLYMKIKQIFTQRSQFTTPEYYNEVILKNVRKTIYNGFYTEADKNLKELISKCEEEDVLSQALVYKAIIALLDRSADYGSILQTIVEIPVKDDDFLEGQKVTLTAIFHYQNNEFEECANLLRQINNDVKFRRFHLEANYYRFRLSLKQYEIDELNKQVLGEARFFLNEIKESPDNCEFFDLISRRPYEKKENLLNDASLLLNQREEALRERVSLDNLMKELSQLRIAIRYNVNRLGGRDIPNEDVVKRAETFKNLISEKYPDLNVDICGISKEEIGLGGYNDDFVFWKNNAAKIFLENDLIKKHALTRLRNYTFLSSLRLRYEEYDLVFIISNI